MNIDWTVVITALITGLVTGIPATIIAWRSSRQINGHLQKFVDAQEGRIASDAVIGEKNEQGRREVEAVRVVAQDKKDAAALERK